jgi:pimeloyl-ACP methyl ester carboxylesterase
MERTISLADGRELALQVEGDPAGPVVVVHYGTPNSRLLFAPHIADAREKGICLVGYDRPGYGGSTRRPGRSIADAAQDVRAIAEALGAERLVTWGISGGGPHALACAALAPDLVVAAASLASLAPRDAPGLDYFAGMGDYNVEDIQLYLADRDAWEEKAASESNEMLTTTIEELLESWRSLLSPVDLEVTTAEVGAYMVAALRSGLAPGPGGYVDDAVAILEPWGFDPSDIEVPVLLWHGRQDRFVPFGHGQWLAARIPGVDAHLSEDDGHLTLLHRVPEVHDWLLAQAA